MKELFQKLFNLFSPSKEHRLVEQDTGGDTSSSNPQEIAMITDPNVGKPLPRREVRESDTEKPVKATLEKKKRVLPKRPKAIPLTEEDENGIDELIGTLIDEERSFAGPIKMSNLVRLCGAENTFEMAKQIWLNRLARNNEFNNNLDRISLQKYVNSRFNLVVRPENPTDDDEVELFFERKPVEISESGDSMVRRLTNTEVLPGSGSDEEDYSEVELEFDFPSDEEVERMADAMEAAKTRREARAYNEQVDAEMRAAEEESNRQAIREYNAQVDAELEKEDPTPLTKEELALKKDVLRLRELARKSKLSIEQESEMAELARSIKKNILYENLKQSAKTLAENIASTTVTLGEPEPETEEEDASASSGVSGEGPQA